MELLNLMAAVATYNAGLPFYVFHSRAGVGMGSRCGLDGDQDLAQMPGIDAFKAMKAYMPAGSSGWDRHAHTSSSNPLILYGDGKALRTTTDGAQSGCMANLASTKGNAFVAALIGCKGTVTLEARYDASFKVLDPLSGAVLQTRALTKGQSFGLSGLAAYVIKGTTSGTTSTAACTGSPLSILQCHRSKYGTPMTDAEMLAVVRDSARDFNSASVPGGPYGILKKATGNNCAGYSCDIICAGQGSSQQQWDVLVASNTPTWGSPLPGPLRIDVCEIQ